MRPKQTKKNKCGRPLTMSWTSAPRKRIHILKTFFFQWRCDPTRVMASSFLRFLDHTQRRTTVGRTPLDEWSVRCKDLYLTTHNTHNRQTTMPPSGIRTHDLSKREAADLQLRPRAHWDRHWKYWSIKLWLNCLRFNIRQSSDSTNTIWD